jgi:hypothetical protein
MELELYDESVWSVEGDPWDANDSKMCLFEDAVPESKLSVVEAVEGTECSVKSRWEGEPWVKEFKIVRVRM